MFHILGRFVLTSSFSRRSSPGFRMGPTRFGFCCCERGLLIVFTISMPSIRALEISSSIFSLFGGLPTVTDTLASTSRGMSSNCVWALARREDGGYHRKFWRSLGAPALSQQRSNDYPRDAPGTSHGRAVVASGVF